MQEHLFGPIRVGRERSLFQPGKLHAQRHAKLPKKRLFHRFHSTQQAAEIQPAEPLRPGLRVPAGDLPQPQHPRQSPFQPDGLHFDVR